MKFIPPDVVASWLGILTDKLSLLRCLVTQRLVWGVNLKPRSFGRPEGENPLTARPAAVCLVCFRLILTTKSDVGLK